MCHGPGGEGVSGGAPPLLGQTDVEKLIDRVRKGGVNMPPMQTLLTAEQIRDVSGFVAAEMQ